MVQALRGRWYGRVSAAKRFRTTKNTDETKTTLYRRCVIVFCRWRNQLSGSHASTRCDVALHRCSVLRSWAEKNLAEPIGTDIVHKPEGI